MTLTWSAWNDGKHLPTGAGYGLKIPIPDRDRYFRRSRSSVVVELPKDGGGFVAHEFNVAKDSFWNSTCHELIGREIGKWLIGRGLAPWPKRERPRLAVEVVGDGRFRVIGVAD